MKNCNINYLCCLKSLLSVDCVNSWGGHRQNTLFDVRGQLVQSSCVYYTLLWHLLHWVSLPGHTHTHSLPKSPLHLASFQPNDGHYHFSITFAGLNCSISGVLCYFRKLKNIQPATVNTIFKLKGSQVQSKCILLYSTLCVFLTVFDVRFYNFRFKAFMQVKHQISTQYNILYCIASGLYVVYSIFPMNT